MITLTPERGRIFRITHIDNIPWILANGLHCRNSPTFDPNYKDIGNPDLIQKRAGRIVTVAPGGTLSDYIPFYFTPYSPMLLNIKTGYNGLKITPMPDIAIIVACLHDLNANGIRFVITDRHAYLATAEFVNDLAGLDRIDWKLLQAKDFKRNPDDPGKFERYQAEALIHRHLPVGALTGIMCHGALQEASLHAHIEGAGLGIQVSVRPDCYF